MMRLTTMAPAVLLAGAMAASMTTAARAQDCEDLWIERNSYYKEAGYCFRTARAIRHFGNSGCRYDNMNDVPLSRSVRARVAEIVRLERNLGCRD
jgi:hypothetical protein